MKIIVPIDIPSSWIAKNTPRFQSSHSMNTYDDSHVHHHHSDIPIVHYNEDFHRYKTLDNHSDIEIVHYYQYTVLKYSQTIAWIIRYLDSPFAKATTCTVVVLFVSCDPNFRLKLKLIALHGISMRFSLVWQVNWNDEGLSSSSARHSTVKVDEQSISRERNTPKPFCICPAHELITCTTQLCFP